MTTQADLIAALGWGIGSRNRAVTRDEMLAILRYVGAISHESGERLCPRCKMMRPGWPDRWRNVGGAGIEYVCGECAGCATAATR